MGIKIVYRNKKGMPENVLAFVEVYAEEHGYQKYIFMLDDLDEFEKHGKEPLKSLEE